MDDRAILQFDCDCFVGALHEEPVRDELALILGYVCTQREPNISLSGLE